MIVYNLTIQVDHSVHDAWLKWLKEEYIPAILSSGQFSDYKFFRLLGQDEEEGFTYVTQFFSPSLPAFQKFQDEFAHPLQQRAIEKWRNNMASFNTIMELIP